MSDPRGGSGWLWLRLWCGLRHGRNLRGGRLWCGLRHGRRLRYRRRRFGLVHRYTDGWGGLSILSASTRISLRTYVRTDA